MPDVNTKTGLRQMSVTAVVTRADGRVEDLGTIAYWHANPFRRFLFRLKRLFRRR